MSDPNIKLGTRTIHGISFTDDLAWMESMKGEKWNSILHKYQTKWNSLFKNEKTKQLQQQLVKELEGENYSSNSEAILFQSGTQVQVGVKGTFTVVWKWKDSNEIYSSTTLTSEGTYTWAIEEVGPLKGAEYYALRLYKKGMKGFLWEQKGVGPFVSKIGNRCYCLEAKKKLVYWRLVSYDAFTGKDKKIHYIEYDYRYNLELKGCFLKRQAGSKEDLFKIGEKGEISVLEGFSLEPRRFLVCSDSDKNKNKNYLVWQNSNWQGIPFSLSGETPESFCQKRKLLVTKKEGKRKLYKYGKCIWEGVGQVLMDPWGGPWVRITQPGCKAVWWNSSSDTKPEKPNPIPLLQTKQNKLPYIYLSAVKKPENVLVIGYGAYGIPTGMNTTRWHPLLHRGWALVILLLRGGGDDTPEWEDSGRCHGRLQVLNDVEEYLQNIQQEIHIDSKNIVLYGRSAGGLWVGGMVSRHPKGDMFGGVYMEVPYLDVIRTTTNRQLPLTEIETDEFGLPEQRLSDLASMLKWSPMDTLNKSKNPSVWQIVRTGLNDSEVYPYESVKWAERCGEKCFLAIEDGQGHFVSGSVGLNQQAEDLAALLTFRVCK